jgi:hypothetical protein
MPELELFLLVVRPLNQLGIRYMLAGSVAAAFYGEPRTTNDVDLVVFFNERDVQRLTEAFPATEFYVPPVETIFAEIRREKNGHFNVIHTDTSFKADIYPSGRDELNAWGFHHKRTIQYEGTPVVLAPPEYVIVSKLEYYREGGSEKHLRDIRSMIATSGTQLDQSALNDWIQRRGLDAEWRLVSN